MQRPAPEPANADATVRAQAQAWLQAGRAAVIVEVCATQGSVPREAGARMLVGADTALGTVGGGHLEWQALQHARHLLAGHTRGGEAPFAETGGEAPLAETGGPAPFAEEQRRYPLGPALGQCCGGVVELAFRPLTAATLQAWAAPPPRFHLQLYGAGHVGRAVVQLLATLPCRVQWLDEREIGFGPLPPHIETLSTDAIEAEVGTAPAQACYLVMTHQHELDLRITEAILRRADFRHFGLIGSATKRARFEHRLRERGIAAEAIARMRCPIGIDGLAGKEPEVIAISAVADLLRATSPER